MSSSKTGEVMNQLQPKIAAETNSLAAAVRSAAGAPAAWREQRRGSFLVMVVGTLALLAVVMLVYVSVGNQDTATKAALARRERLDDVPQQFADYLSVRVIGADVLSTYYDNAGIPSTRADAQANEPVLLREAFDYGYTDWRRRSDTLDRATAFTPIGSFVRLPETVPPMPPTRENPDPIFFGNAPARWVPSDPWLASNEPTWLGFKAGGGNDFTAGLLEPASYEPARIKKDWLHISNVAPDGKFVNLYNLAPVVGPRRVGNINAKPGLGTSDDGFGALPRLSEGLILLGDGGDNAAEADTRGTTTVWGTAVTGARRNFPAYYDSWQRGLFRPADDSLGNPGAGDYLPYQFADADGDGMLDSRWMELSDSRLYDATNDASRIVNLLESDGKFRYFFAVRIIDASGMVNVNTAADLAAAPDAANPVGLTPADIDLRRLLTLHDVYDGIRAKPTQFAGLLGRTQAGYDAIKNPSAAADPTGVRADNYGAISNAPPNAGMPPAMDGGYDAIRAYTVGSSAYMSLRLSLAAGTFVPLASAVDPAVEYRGINLPLAFATDAFNRYGYSGAGTIENRDSRDPIARRLWDFTPGQDSYGAVFARASDYLTAGIQTEATNPHSPPNFTAGAGESLYPSLPARRRQYYTSQASAILSTQSALIAANGNNLSQFQPAGTFGIDDLGELLTYRASNDIDVLSNLERVLGGRDWLIASGVAAADAAINPRKFDPLRSNRGPDLELVRDTASGTRDQTAGADGRADMAARLQLDADVRQRLTTISGARSLTTRRDVNFDRIETGEIKTNAAGLLQNIVSFPNQPVALSSVNTLFGGYCDALLPFSGIAGTWDSAGGQFDNFKTLSYGYAGSEPAIYAAAHMAANMADLADDDSTPGAWTLLLNNASFNAVSTSTLFHPWTESSTGAGDGRRLDLDAAVGIRGTGQTRLATAATGGSLVAPAVNIYGVEPQPFVTAVATFTVYTDRPETATPAGSRDGWDPSDSGDTPEPVDIRPDVSEFNYDFMYRVLAFRLHNPFAVDITLGDPRAVFNLTDVTSAQIGALASQIDLGDAGAMSLDRQKDFYYLKFGGRTFMLTALREEADTVTGDYAPTPIGGGLDITAQPLIIKAGASAVVYATSQIPRTIMERNILTADPGFIVSGGNKRALIRGLIERQFRAGANVNSDDAYFWIPEIDVDPSSPSSGSVGVLSQSPTSETSVPLPNGQGVFKPWVGPSGALDPLAFGQLMQQVVDDVPIKKEYAQSSVAEERALILNTEVQLWRAVRDGVPGASDPVVAGEYNAATSIAVPGSSWDGSIPMPGTSARVYVRNDYKNDQLVDRMRLPLKSSDDTYVDLDARIKVDPGVFSDDVKVADSESDPASIDGLTVLYWAGARRPQDPSINNDQPLPVGALPAFCLESKNPGDYLASPVVESWNLFARQDQTGGIGWTAARLKYGYFSSPSAYGKAAGLTLRSWAQQTLTTQHCSLIAYSSTQKLPAIDGWEESTAARNFPENKTTLRADLPYNEQYAQVLASNSPTSSVAGADRFTSTFRVQSGTGSAPSHSTLRVGDLLLPMGIGPVEAPIDASGAVVDDLNVRWTTLGEAITIAMGYDVPVNDPPSSAWTGLVGDAANMLRPVQIGADPFTATRNRWRHMFDRGNLVLDDFAPFYNTDGDAEGIFRAGANRDQRMFTQIPLALNVLDMFSAAVAGDETITRSVPGLVNINSAPLAVARALPLLSPMTRPTNSEVLVLKITASAGSTFTFTVNSATTPNIDVGASPAIIQAALEALPGIGKGNVVVSAGDRDRNNTGAGWPGTLVPYAGCDYVITFTGALSTADLAANFLTCTGGTPVTVVEGSGVRIGPGFFAESPGIDQSVDLAATLVANRDKIEVPLRPQSWSQFLPDSLNIPMLSVRYLGLDSAAGFANPDHNVDDLISRANESDIPAVSETPGFQSLGALMTLRYRGRNLGGVDPFEGSMRTSIDYMGYRTNDIPQDATGFFNHNQSAIGIDSVLMGKTLPVPGFTLPTPSKDVASVDGINDEFKEKLAIANAVVNTTSTRSDYYIAWFVVHGYQQSDVESLGAGDVLTPSIARRFMMVVDRSNVVKTGDKPNVLLFKEVPYKGR